MNTAPSFLLAYLVNALWQTPLILAFAWIAARLARPIGPRAEHRIWVAALLAEPLLPLCRLNLGHLWHNAWALFLSRILPSHRGPAHAGEVTVFVGLGSAPDAGALHLPAWLLTAILAAYATSLLYCIARLCWGLWRTSQMRHQSKLIQTRPAQTQPTSIEWSEARAAAFEHLLRRHGLSSIEIAVSPSLSSPVTLGIRRPTVLLPANLLSRIGDADLEAVLAHELTHIARRDFARNLLYQFLSLPIAFHPALWITRARLAETREMICDEIAAGVSRHNYAHALLRLAAVLSQGQPAPTFHAIGVFDANTLERRIMNLTRNSRKLTVTRRIAITAASLAIALTAILSATAFHMSVFAAQSSPQEPLQVKADQQIVLIQSDQIILIEKKMPIYPAEAKANHDTLNGSVILHATISKTGNIENLVVKKPLREDYEQSALDAVRQWRYQPYLLNGEPVEVQTDIRIIYSTPDGKPADNE